MSRIPRLGSCLVVTSLVTAFAFAVPAAGQETGGQSLDQAASDPTASVMSLQFADWYTYDYHDLPGGDDNVIALRAAIPFQTGNLHHIFRVTAPIITDHPVLDSGLGDLTVFDLLVFEESWGRWGVGAVALLPTGGDDRGADQWAAGPAFGFTARAAPGLLVGLFNQNLFHITGDQALGQADVNISNIQPLLNYQLGKGWSVGFSEMNIIYDWDADEFTSLPLGIGVSKLQRFGTQPVQFNLQYEHDFYDDVAGPSDTVRASAKFLFAVN
jgi:hypothetical protein